MDRPKSISNLYLLFNALELFIKVSDDSLILVTGIVVFTFYTTYSTVFRFIFYHNTEPFLNLPDFIHGIFIIVFMYILFSC